MSDQDGGRVRPFSNGSQFGDWVASNCERCVKGTSEEEPAALCQIAAGLGEAYWGDGTVSAEIGRRMGYPGPLSYNWRCGEVIWSEEWKAEWARRRAAKEATHVS